MIDHGGACGVLFLDLSKAFDTVDHDILCYKLKCLGLKQSSVSWFKSYVDDRQQSTRVGKTMSNFECVSSGVPQGSILGPLLFTCYTNDMPAYCTHMTPFIYADDTALLVKGTEIETINQKLQDNFNILESWFQVNKLSLNVKKTRAVLFCGKRSRHRNDELCIKSGTTVIETDASMKYLGVHLDNNLTFDDHINNISKKVSQRTRLLWKMRNFISLDLAKYLYTTSIQPVFIYCDFIYDGTSKTNKQKLQICQNSALRAVKNCRLDYPTTTVNDHGVALIHFCLQTKMCICNGGITPLNDNYTSISHRGRAVVDYVLVPHECLPYIDNLCVVPCSDLIDKYSLDVHKGRLSDHSLITVRFN